MLYTEILKKRATVAYRPDIRGSDPGGRPGASKKQKYNPQILLRHLPL
jgi:hypothetical protein